MISSLCSRTCWNLVTAECFGGGHGPISTKHVRLPCCQFWTTTLRFWAARVTDLKDENYHNKQWTSQNGSPLGTLLAQNIAHFTTHPTFQPRVETENVTTVLWPHGWKRNSSRIIKCESMTIDVRHSAKKLWYFHQYNKQKHIFLQTMKSHIKSEWQFNQNHRPLFDCKLNQILLPKSETYSKL